MSKPPLPLFCENAEEKLGQFLRHAREYQAQFKRDDQARKDIPSDDDPVNHPKHYTAHPSGVECIEIAEHMSFCLGNVLKYIWRAGTKGKQIEDLKKAEYYIRCEIARIERANDDAVKNQTY